MADEEGQSKKSYGLIAAGCGVIVVIVCFACLGPGLVAYMTPDWIDTPHAGVTSTPDPGRPPAPAPVAPISPNATPWERQGLDRPSYVEVTMEISEAIGLSIPQYTSCSFLIHDRGENCQTHVVCAGVSLYGDGVSQGYFQCDFPVDPWSFSIADTGVTELDGDGAITVNAPLNQVRITDDATGIHGVFTLSASISSIRYSTGDEF